MYQKDKEVRIIELVSRFQEATNVKSINNLNSKISKFINNEFQD